MTAFTMMSFPTNTPLLFDGNCSQYSCETGNTSSTAGEQLHCHCANMPAERMAAAKAKKKLLLSTILCIFFIAGECFGGYISHSLAIMADAAHMLSDFTSFCISLLSIWISGRKPKKSFNYGYLRAEAIGALLTLMLIWFVTGILLWLAGNRLVYPDSFTVEPDPMMIVASCAVGFNIVLGFLLHGVPHGHSHGHSDQPHINIRGSCHSCSWGSNPIHRCANIFNNHQGVSGGQASRSHLHTDVLSHRPLHDNPSSP